MTERHANKGLRKLCACPRRAWPKCAHAWHFSFAFRRRPYRFSLDRYLGRPVKTKTEAQAAADIIKTAIRHGTFGPPDATVRSALTLTKLFTLYTRDYLDVVRAASKGNLSYQVPTITRTELDRPEGGHLPFGDWPLDDITTDVIEQFQSVRRSAGAVAANRDLSLLRALFNWAASKRRRYVRENPFVDGGQPAIHLTKEAGRTRRLDPAECDQLLAACHADLRAIVEAAIETGCRKGELLSLQWSQVRLIPRRELVLPAVKTKTRTDRHVPVSDRLQTILEMRAAVVRTHLKLEDTEATPGHLYVFGNELGEPVTTFKRAWETAVLRAHSHQPAYVTTLIDGEPRRTATLTPECRAWLRAIGLHFHDLRREAGSRWLEGGVPLHIVRDWLGHANIAQTSTYLSGTTKGQHDAMRLFDLRRASSQLLASEDGKTDHQPALSANQTDPDSPERTIKHH